LSSFRKRLPQQQEQQSYEREGCYKFNRNIT